ncbi:unnamed protein product [Closterium sp. Naga37s-1]|nr:unnamed protein product [Closterium sp. Naga37s-1]
MVSVSASAEGHLLPGLPHDLALACMSRLALWDLPAARCVSRGWAAAIRSASFGRLRRRVRAEEGGGRGAGRGEWLRHRWAEGRGKGVGEGKGMGKALGEDEGEFHSMPNSLLSDSEKRLPPMPLGSHLPGPAGVKEGHCESPGAAALLVACVGGSGGEGSGRQRLQWFACCTCEACYPSRTGHPCAPCDPFDPCQPCDRYGSSPDLCGFCTPNAFPRWRRLPPLPPTNPHSDPACYGAVAAAVPGTGIAIVGGALPSQSGRPQHVRHVSVFDWHMGAWFDVQQPCLLPRLDPVVAAMGAMSGGGRDCLVVVGGCAVPSFPRASAAGSCARMLPHATHTYQAPHDPRNPHDPGVMREILLPDLHALSSLSALLPHTSSSFPHLPSLPSLQPSPFALSQLPHTVGPAPLQAQASESVSIAAAGGLMRLVSSGNVESQIGWAMGAPVALPGNGRLHHVLSVAI